MIIASTPAYAAPVNEKKQQAVAVKGQIDRLDKQAEIASERYNEARGRYQSLTVKVGNARTKLTKLRARIGTLQDHLRTRAGSMYRSGRLGFLEVLLGAKSFDEFTSKWDVLSDMNEDEANAVRELKQIREEVTRTERELTKAQAEAKKQKDLMASNESRVRARLADRKRLLKGLESEIAALEAAERQRADEAARAARVRWVRSNTPSSDSDYGTPTNAPRSSVVSIAMRYLGRPYQWAADGPNSFDCSGFTMYVYRQVGVSLPHSSRAQIGSGQRVSRSNLQPGDLVFFGSPIHHVGIYIGGGQYIHAPRTGDVVKISPLNRRDYAGACRP